MLGDGQAKRARQVGVSTGPPATFTSSMKFS